MVEVRAEKREGTLEPTQHVDVGSAAGGREGDHRRLTITALRELLTASWTSRSPPRTLASIHPSPIDVRPNKDFTPSTLDQYPF